MKTLSKCFLKHIKTYKRTYFLGLFGSFAIVKTFLLMLGFFGAVYDTQQHASAYFYDPVSTCSTVVDVPASECEVLLNLYNGLNGDYWNNTTSNNQPRGDPSTICTNRYGISCYNNHISQINLQWNNTNGTIPSLVNLTQLEYFALAGIYSISNLTSFETPASLRALLLMYGNMTSFPNLTNKPNLDSLSLYANQLTSIPSNIFSEAPNIGGINLSENNISSIPSDAFSGILHLYQLYLDGNELISMEPFMQLTLLNQLSLAQNNISIVPDSIINLTNLQIGGLNVYYNNINYPLLSQGVLDFIDAKHINRGYDRRTTQTIPFTDCAHVDVPEAECLVLQDFYNGLNGDNRNNQNDSYTDDDRFANTNKVCTRYGISCTDIGDGYMHIYGIGMDKNNLIGTLPSGLSTLSQLRNLNLHSNELTESSFPADFVNMTQLQNGQLYLYYNRINALNLTQALIDFIDTKHSIKEGDRKAFQLVCGDGYIVGEELCDDGNANGTPGHCNLTCDGIVPSVCGNGIIEMGETCDDGDNNGTAGYCDTSCILPTASELKIGNTVDGALIASFANRSRQYLGTPGNSKIPADYPNIAVNSDSSKAYVAYINSADKQLIVKQFIDGAWQIIGNKFGLAGGENIPLVAYGNLVYVAYLDDSGYIKIQRYDGANRLDISPKGTIGSAIALTVDPDGVPFGAYIDNKDGTLRVIKYDENIRKRETVGSPNFGYMRGNKIDIKVSPNYKIYVAFQEEKNGLAVWKYNYIYRSSISKGLGTTDRIDKLYLTINEDNQPVVGYTIYYSKRTYVSYIKEYINGERMQRGEDIFHTSLRGIDIDPDNNILALFRNDFADTPLIGKLTLKSFNRTDKRRSPRGNELFSDSYVNYAALTTDRNKTPYIIATPRIRNNATVTWKLNIRDNARISDSEITWQRNGAPIEGATQQTYAPSKSDIGNRMTFELTPVDTLKQSMGTKIISPETRLGGALDVHIEGIPTNVGYQVDGQYTYVDYDKERQSLTAKGLPDDKRGEPRNMKSDSNNNLYMIHYSPDYGIREVRMLANGSDARTLLGDTYKERVSMLEFDITRSIPYIIINNTVMMRDTVKKGRTTLGEKLPAEIFQFKLNAVGTPYVLLWDGTVMTRDGTRRTQVGENRISVGKSAYLVFEPATTIPFVYATEERILKYGLNAEKNIRERIQEIPVYSSNYTFSSVDGTLYAVAANGRLDTVVQWDPVAAEWKTHSTTTLTDGYGRLLSPTPISDMLILSTTEDLGGGKRAVTTIGYNEITQKRELIKATWDTTECSIISENYLEDLIMRCVDGTTKSSYVEILAALPEDTKATTYQWYIEEGDQRTPIEGATAQTLDLTENLREKQVSFGVKAVSLGGRIRSEVISQPIIVGPIDTDDDGIADIVDNCINVPNPNQENTDGILIPKLLIADAEPPTTRLVPRVANYAIDTKAYRDLTPGFDIANVKLGRNTFGDYASFSHTDDTIYVFGGNSAAVPVTVGFVEYNRITDTYNDLTRAMFDSLKRDLVISMAEFGTNQVLLGGRVIGERGIKIPKLGYFDRNLRTFTDITDQAKLTDIVRAMETYDTFTFFAMYNQNEGTTSINAYSTKDGISTIRRYPIGKGTVTEMMYYDNKLYVALTDEGGNTKLITFKDPTTAGYVFEDLSYRLNRDLGWVTNPITALARGDDGRIYLGSAFKDIKLGTMQAQFASFDPKATTPTFANLTEEFTAAFPKARQNIDAIIGIRSNDGVGDACDCDDAMCTTGTNISGALICDPVDPACPTTCTGASIQSCADVSIGVIKDPAARCAQFYGITDQAQCVYNPEIRQCVGGTGCIVPEQPTYCGDGIIQTPNDDDVNEVCDGNDLNGLTCADFGMNEGIPPQQGGEKEKMMAEGAMMAQTITTLTCNDDCLGFDTGNCVEPVACSGTQVDYACSEITIGEQDDPAVVCPLYYSSMDDAQCIPIAEQTVPPTEERKSSILSPLRTLLNTLMPNTQAAVLIRGCTAGNLCIVPECGNNIVEQDEQCDDGNTENGDGCSAKCTVEHPASPCGNGIIDEGEQCDGQNLDRQTCTTQGFIGGNLTCTPQCTFNTNSCITTACGNGIVDEIQGEACDGNDLNDQTCVTQGFDEGTLSCTPQCTIDTNACTEIIPVTCYGQTVENAEDRDNDYVADKCDNCPGFANPQQLDTDKDGFGDACDQCPDQPNTDINGDGNIGPDECDVIVVDDETYSGEYKSTHFGSEVPVLFVPSELNIGFFVGPEALDIQTNTMPISLVVQSDTTANFNPQVPFAEFYLPQRVGVNIPGACGDTILRPPLFIDTITVRPYITDNRMARLYEAITLGLECPDGDYMATFNPPIEVRVYSPKFDDNNPTLKMNIMSSPDGINRSFEGQYNVVNNVVSFTTNHLSFRAFGLPEDTTPVITPPPAEEEEETHHAATDEHGNDYCCSDSPLYGGNSSCRDYSPDTQDGLCIRIEEQDQEEIIPEEEKATEEEHAAAEDIGPLTRLELARLVKPVMEQLGIKPDNSRDATCKEYDDFYKNLSDEDRETIARVCKANTMGVDPNGVRRKPNFDGHVLVTWKEVLTVIDRIITFMKNNVCHENYMTTSWYQYHVAYMNKLAITPNEPAMITAPYVQEQLLDRILENTEILSRGPTILNGSCKTTARSNLLNNAASHGSATTSTTKSSSSTIEMLRLIQDLKSRLNK